jgi:hypothetical protein
MVSHAEQRRQLSDVSCDAPRLGSRRFCGQSLGVARIWACNGFHYLQPLQRLGLSMMSALSLGTTARRIRHAFPLVVALAAMALPSALLAQAVEVSVAFAPPELPVYDQPEIPGPGYLWTPGFWDYGPEGYYWVPGTWVEPPAVGLLWTPGYWAWNDGVYIHHVGYWGPHVGFYGGVNYGFGYGGSGYEGGYWRNGAFAYNTTVNNFGNVHITNVYSKTVIKNVNVTRVSFNGGAGGVATRPTPQEMAVASEQHIAPTTIQTQHVQAASANHSLLASVNHGKPAILATSKPADFSGHGLTRGTGGNDFKKPNDKFTNRVPGGGTEPLNAVRANPNGQKPPKAANLESVPNATGGNPSKNFQDMRQTGPKGSNGQKFHGPHQPGPSHAAQAGPPPKKPKKPEKPQQPH